MLYDVYLYDADTGELSGVLHSLEQARWKSVAQEQHFKEGYTVKVYDQLTNHVVYTLGI
jgi:hypothetical protein